MGTLTPFRFDTGPPFKTPGNLKFHQAIVDQDMGPDLDIFGQIPIGNRDNLIRSLNLAGRKRKGLAILEHHLPVSEVPKTDLRPLGIQQGRNGQAQPVPDLTKLDQTSQLLLVISMGEIKAGDVHTGPDQFLHQPIPVSGWSHGTDDFRLALVIHEKFSFSLLP